MQTKWMVFHHAFSPLTTNILQGDCDSSCHFSRSSKSPVSQLFIGPDSWKYVTYIFLKNLSGHLEQWRHIARKFQITGETQINMRESKMWTYRQCQRILAANEWSRRRGLRLPSAKTWYKVQEKGFHYRSQYSHRWVSLQIYMDQTLEECFFKARYECLP